VLTWLRELAATVGRFDRAALEPGFALRCTIGVAIPLVVATALGQPAMGVAAAIGAFITGFTSLQGIYRTRVRAILLAAFGMALTGFIGALAAHSVAGLVAATLVAAYLCAAIGQLGPAAATVCLNSLIAFILFSSQALAPPAALEQSALILGGGLLQAVLVVVVAPFARLGNERVALADVYAKLAEYARSAAHGSAELPPITPLATARQILADPQPLARSAERARLNRMFEDALQIRGQLAALSASGRVPAVVPERLDHIASVLLGKASKTVEEWAEIPEAPQLGQALRDAIAGARILAGTGLPHNTLLSKPRPAPYVDTHIAWLSRDAIRFSLVLGIAMVLARHFAADRGYWIPLTAAIVLKPDFQTTFVRGFARIGGTILGAIIATLVLAALRNDAGLEVAGILIATGVAYLAFFPNYAVFTVAITSFVVLVLHMRGLPGTTTIEARLLDTLGGGALAMIGYLVLPSWEGKRTRALLADLVEAQRDLSTVILEAYAKRTPESNAAMARARNAAWRARTAVEASVDRSQQEPNRPHTIGPGRALRILAATQRFGLANLALETAIDAPLDEAFRSAIGAFSRALSDRMGELADALHEARRITEPDRLPAALAKIDAMLSPASSPAKRFVADRLGTYVDATSAIARLIGYRSATSG
jgi:uncharacterized membrane protein YccC